MVARCPDATLRIPAFFSDLRHLGPCAASFHAGTAFEPAARRL